MPRRSTVSLTPDEARQLHRDALVIDAQQPHVTEGLIFTDTMRKTLAEYHAQGMSRAECHPLMIDMAAREIGSSSDARRQFLDIWRKSGVTAVCGTYSGVPGNIAFEIATKRIGQAYAYMEALDGQLELVRKAADIERIHREGKFGLILDFQNATPYSEYLERIEIFYNLGVRMVQLTYNLRNLTGDGCTEMHQSGLTYFGREVVRRLNDLRTLVDVSHCSEQVGWDALEVSTAPIVVSHSSSKAVCRHDRAKSDELAKAVADRGGFFGIVIVPGFISESTETTLEDFARHVEHLVNVCGIDHVGVGTDKTGPGAMTGFLFEFPDGMRSGRSNDFDWLGFREAHRITDKYHLNGFENFGDWPNLTVQLAKSGFNEDEIRKLIGRNFLRVFRDVVG